MTETTSNELVVKNVENALASMNSETSNRVAHTFIEDDFNTKLSVVAALADATPIADALGSVINLTNIVAEQITITDSVTNKEIETIRTILIDDAGNAYSTVSESVFNALSTMFSILGKPHTWDKPVPVTVVEKKAKLGKFFALVPVLDAPSKK